MSPTQPADHPGAGTLWAYGLPDAGAGSGSPRRYKHAGLSSRSASRTSRGRRARVSDDESDEADENSQEGVGDWPPSWSAVRSERPQTPLEGISPDALLSRGVAEYTLMPSSQGGVLGRGKFSTVYKVRGSDGQIVSTRIWTLSDGPSTQ